MTDQRGPVHLVSSDGLIVCGAKSTRQWTYGSHWEFDSPGKVLTISPSLLARGFTRARSACGSPNGVILSDSGQLTSDQTPNFSVVGSTSKSYRAYAFTLAARIADLDERLMMGL